MDREFAGRKGPSPVETLGRQEGILGGGRFPLPLIADLTLALPPPPAVDAFIGTAVADESGNPVEVYHGTPVFPNGMGQDITSFNRAWTVEHLRGRRPSLDNVGVWFSSIRGDKDKGAAMYAGEHGQVYRVHLAIKNPWVTTFANMADQAWQLNGCPELRDGVFTRSKGSFSPEPLRDWLKNQGYDGIKVIHDPARQGTSTEFKDQDAWIVLEPDQVRILGNAPAHPDEDPAFPGIMP